MIKRHGFILRVLGSGYNLDFHGIIIKGSFILPFFFIQRHWRRGVGNYMMEEFPLVNFQNKSKNVIIVLEDSFIDGNPIIDVEKLDGEYVYGIHKKFYDHFIDEWNMEIHNKTIKMRRKK